MKISVEQHIAEEKMRVAIPRRPSGRDDLLERLSPGGF